MRIPFYVVLLVLGLFGGLANAQDFEADSVYYTPIAKTSFQEKTKTNIKAFRDTVQSGKFIGYFFNLQVGPLIGCKDCSSQEVSFTTATTHGVTIGKKLRTGIGIGFDSFDAWQTLPVFGTVSWDLLGTKNTHAVVVEANYGWSAGYWRKAQEFEYGLTDIDGGRMFSLLVGYRIRYHDVKIGLLLGGKQQQVSSYFEYPTYRYGTDGTAIPGTPNTRTLKEDLRRFMITLSIGWK